MLKAYLLFRTRTGASKEILELNEKDKKANIKINIALFGEDNLIKQIQNKFNIKIKKINIDTKF